MVRRVNTFTDAHAEIAHLPLGTRAAIYIAQLPGVLPSTRLTYAASMRALTNRLGQSSSLLGFYASALTAAGGGGIHTAEAGQAVPATREQVRRAVLHFLIEDRPELAVAVYLMWKTASRFDDVRLLTPRCLLLRQPARCVIQWPSWKTNRAGRRYVHSWTVVDEENYPEMLQHLYALAERTQPAQSMIGAITTTTFARTLQRVPGCESLTAHSFKRGVARELFQKLAAGEISNADMRLIPMLLKHRDELHDMPTSTLGYVENVVDLAISLRSQVLTRLL